ncbi:MAG: MoaD/ThiS family protein [Ignisphaera sp.]
MKNVVGVSTIEFRLNEKMELGKFFQLVLNTYPNLGKLLNREGRINEGEFLILINGVDIRVFSNPYKDIEVEDTDEIVFIPITHGG